MTGKHERIGSRRGVVKKKKKPPQQRQESNEVSREKSTSTRVVLPSLLALGGPYPTERSEFAATSGCRSWFPGSCGSCFSHASHRLHADARDRQSPRTSATLSFAHRRQTHRAKPTSGSVT